MTTQTQSQPCTSHTAPVCNLTSNLDWVRDWSVWGFDDHGALSLNADPADSCDLPCAPLGDFSVFCHAGDDASFVKAKEKAMAWFDLQCK